MRWEDCGWNETFRLLVLATKAGASPVSSEEEEAQAQSTVSNAEAVVVAGSGIACRDRGQGGGWRRVCER